MKTTSRQNWFLSGLVAILMSAWMFAASATPALSQAGEIIELTQPVDIIKANGERTRLALGDAVELDDIIRTGQGGNAQILFPDETRIVVGPSSQLRIQQLLFRSDNTARRMTVSAAVGTFRFLSGDSAPRAYSVRTPIATMGVRGTAFDFAVPSRDDTDLVVHDGEVRFCRRGGACARVPSGCQTVQLDRSGFSQPETQEEREEILEGRFPFARSQANLGETFRIGIENCTGGSGNPPVQIRLPSSSAAAFDGSDSPSSAPARGPGINPAE